MSMLKQSVMPKNIILILHISQDQIKKQLYDRTRALRMVIWIQIKIRVMAVADYIHGCMEPWDILKMLKR